MRPAPTRWTLGGQINDVLARTAVGGPDAATDTAFTMLFGGQLAPGGTVTLKTNLAATADLPAGSSLTIDGAGDTLAEGTFAGLTVAAGDVVVRNLTVTGAPAGWRLPAARWRSATAGAAGGGEINFIGAATLELAAGVAVSNTIDGFTGGDAIALDGIDNGSAHFDSATHPTHHLRHRRAQVVQFGDIDCYGNRSQDRAGGCFGRAPPW